MKFVKNKIFMLNKVLCELQEDGSVTFDKDISIEELKYAVGAALRELCIHLRGRLLSDILDEDGVAYKAVEEELKKINEKAARNASLDEMVRLSEEMGLYDEPKL